MRGRLGSNPLPTKLIWKIRQISFSLTAHLSLQGVDTKLVSRDLGALDGQFPSAGLRSRSLVHAQPGPGLLPRFSIDEAPDVTVLPITFRTHTGASPEGKSQTEGVRVREKSRGSQPARVSLANALHLLSLCHVFCFVFAGSYHPASAPRERR